MAKLNVLQLDIRNLFANHSINEILEIEKCVDAEIERKRIELRSIVGDRYKDILTATEAIKSIESISESIVKDIQSVLDKCDVLVKNTNTVIPSKLPPVEKEILDERVILMQIKLAIELNEHIWIATDDGDFCGAAQFYLLAQHVHTGLRLLKKDMMNKYKLISKLKGVVDVLREKILLGCLNKLKNIELTVEETCSLLNAIMLLENHASTDLLNKFITIRKNALETVINESFPSVRIQISTMVKCIYTTFKLLHDCFFNYKATNEGLIWKELNEIVNKEAPTTLSKLHMDLPMQSSNMLVYIPKIIKEFRPKCSNVNSTLAREEALALIQMLLSDLTNSVGNGLSSHLELVPNIKGLHLIREEALKIEMPKRWETICLEIALPRGFDVWYYFFQDFMTQRVQFLITNKITQGTNTLCVDIIQVLNSNDGENDLRWYVWHENSLNDDHKVLVMKTKGFSPTIVQLCEDFDAKYFELLKDVSLYLYGKEYNIEDGFYGKMQSQTSGNKKFVDMDKLEGHLKEECLISINKLISNLEKEIKTHKENLVTKSIICARFLTALTFLCPNFNKCCSCNHSSDEWEKICSLLNKSSLIFWANWINNCNDEITNLMKNSFDITNACKMLTTLCRWDAIEIQEQTDESSVFKSQIKIPMKSSMALERVLDAMTRMLNALFPHTLPKQVHLKFMEKNVLSILQQYETLMLNPLNQMQALQFLFDVKFMSTLTVPRENMALVQRSQDVCDKFRSFVDPFDLDVFYKYLQHNVRQNALQSQIIYGSLLPSSNQLASLGLLEKNKEHEKDPSILALSTPSNNGWFMLLPVTAPTTKTSHPTMQVETKINAKEKPKRNQENSVRSGAAALFGAMTTDWFS